MPAARRANTPAEPEPVEPADPPTTDPDTDEPPAGAVIPDELRSAIREEAKAGFTEWLDENKPTSKSRKSPTTGYDLLDSLFGWGK